MSFLAKFTLGLLLVASSTAQASITSDGDITPSNPLDWTSSTNVNIGYDDDGTLAINGGDDLPSGDIYLGYDFGATGSVTISDANSTWSTKTLYVGFHGNGEVNISNGGTVSSHQGTLGYKTASTGTINVSGNGATWENGSDLTVGGFGKGQLNITEGGLVRVAGKLTIDPDNSGNSFVNITTGGMLALWGEAADSITAFMGLVNGTDAIRWWNDSLDDWVLLTEATPNTNYTLEEYLGGYTLLTVRNAPVPGDANGDGKVNGSDVTILAGSWQILTGATWEMGDFNGDGAVNGSDVTILAGNWQAGVNTTTALAIPEPGTLLTLLFGLLALGFVRHIK